MDIAHPPRSLPARPPACLLRWLSPLKPLGVPTQRIALTLLLSLRFMSLVFEEVRNLCLGLAARGVDWRAQGGRGSMDILGRLVVRLFGNLFTRSEKISQVGAGWWSRSSSREAREGVRLCHAAPMPIHCCS